MKTSELISEANALPVEERAALIDCLMRGLTAPDLESEPNWIALAKRRREELTTGAVEPIPGEKVFEKIRDRFAKKK